MKDGILKKSTGHPSSSIYADLLEILKTQSIDDDIQRLNLGGLVNPSSNACTYSKYAPPPLG